MQTAGKIAAAIEIIDDFDQRRVPLKMAIADWARGARYAGAKDRAWISGLCLDVLRRRQSLSNVMGTQTGRAAVLGALHFMWKMKINDIDVAVSEEPHGPGALSNDERKVLSGDFVTVMDVPEWVEPMLARAVGNRVNDVADAMAMRADVDLRLNTLKAQPEKSLQALKSVKGKAISVLKTTARIEAPDPSERAPAVTVIPAFNKGWIEVQDLGSQIAAAVAGDIKGAQVLDFCAGGGGKTLALCALMENTGQLYAYDIDARRLKPLFHRAKRAGVRNLQIRSPAGGEGLDDLKGKMDVVFVDAPCSGSGTWRRHPDTKWRLTEQQLARRMEEQDEVLGKASAFVKPGGKLVYVTCSFLREENEDRIEAFLAQQSGFSLAPAISSLFDSGIIDAQGKPEILKCVTPEGFIRLSPDYIKADGFFIAVLMCA